MRQWALRKEQLMTAGKLRIATCQFPVCGSIERNAGYVHSFMKQAVKGGAHIVHFSECALSGYAPADVKTFDRFDWRLLRAETEEIMKLAKELHLWVVLGGTHRLTEPNKPHNSLYLISPRGRIVDRYDKRFCMLSDLEYYTPGNRFVIFTVNGVRCALLICYDLRFPELYRELKKAGASCVIQSFYNARQKGRTIQTDIMRQTMQCRAATNYFWVSMANSSARYQSYPSCFIRPDGTITAQLRQHRPGIMFNTVDLGKEFYDASGPFRALAMKGALTSSPKIIRDKRSKTTTQL
jgi:predicted amidohydrolase